MRFLGTIGLVAGLALGLSPSVATQPSFPNILSNLNGADDTSNILKQGHGVFHTQCSPTTPFSIEPSHLDTYSFRCSPETLATEHAYGRKHLVQERILEQNNPAPSQRPSDAHITVGDENDSQYGFPHPDELIPPVSPLPQTLANDYHENSITSLVDALPKIFTEIVLHQASLPTHSNQPQEQGVSHFPEYFDDQSLPNDDMTLELALEALRNDEKKRKRPPRPKLNPVREWRAFTEGNSIQELELNTRSYKSQKHPKNFTWLPLPIWPSETAQALSPKDFTTLRPFQILTSRHRALCSKEVDRDLIKTLINAYEEQTKEKPTTQHEVLTRKHLPPLSLLHTTHTFKNSMGKKPVLTYLRILRNQNMELEIRVKKRFEQLFIVALFFHSLSLPSSKDVVDEHKTSAFAKWLLNICFNSSSNLPFPVIGKTNIGKAPEINDFRVSQKLIFYFLGTPRCEKVLDATALSLVSEWYKEEQPNAWGTTPVTAAVSRSTTNYGMLGKSSPLLSVNLALRVKSLNYSSRITVPKLTREFK
ncbi:hypothetical protein O181_032868 [Austropuccinia psidii MF-1]|uniref:Uncharacterized protein n=1 Tax=Austropuccinia psidii MF-1 TaxID=1389203 RepID=A0A9Q3D2G4_9BASI|nr:hypothetical protein [Austropuccinia psidii MF-1]